MGVAIVVGDWKAAILIRRRDVDGQVGSVDIDNNWQSHTLVRHNLRFEHLWAPMRPDWKESG
jgi:hypothetical protein